MLSLTQDISAIVRWIIYPSSFLHMPGTCAWRWGECRWATWRKVTTFPTITMFKWLNCRNLAPWLLLAAPSVRWRGTGRGGGSSSGWPTPRRIIEETCSFDKFGKCTVYIFLQWTKRFSGIKTVLIQNNRKELFLCIVLGGKYCHYDFTKMSCQ